MSRIFVYEPLSAGAPDTAQAREGDSAAEDELLAAGRSMRDAIVDDLTRIPPISVTVAVSQQETRHGGRWNGVQLAAALPGEDAVAFVARQASLHDLCWVVAPESDGLLLRLHQAVGDARWIGCSAAAIRVASSKSATCTALGRAGIPTPAVFAAGHAGPWIVKPDDGAGTTDTRRHATADAAQADLRERQRAGLAAVMEPFVRGEALSIAMIVGPNLARPIAFNRQRLDIDADGWLHDLGVQAAAITATDPRAAVLHALALRVAAALPGLGGYVGVDVVWNERDGPVVIEVNPRVTCAYVGLSAILQRNLAAEILAAHAGASARAVVADAAA
jgi:predicted ATP-grasp superfamily ATP-dependent carboligase